MLKFLSDFNFSRFNTYFLSGFLIHSNMQAQHISNIDFNSTPKTELAVQLNSTHQLDLRLIYFKNSRWDLSSIKENLVLTNSILSQCGIELGKIDLVNATEKIEEIYFDLEGYTDPLEKHNASGALNFAKKYSKSDTANVFFFERFDSEYGHIPATAVPLTRISQNDQIVAANSVWMPYLAEINRMTDLSDGGHSKDFNTLAHEVTHLLLDDSHFQIPSEYNLMHEMRSNLNGRLNQEQCRKIRNSKLLKPKSNNNHNICSDIKSPLARNIFVSYFEISSIENSKYRQSQCTKISKIITSLENAQEQVSDLLPATQLDFYFVGQGNEISHSDRNSFTANINLTYDMHGQTKIPFEQEEILWIHELGHAVLNQQLANDWNWYSERIKLFKSWGNSIAESTEIENRLKNEKSTDHINSFQKRLDNLSKSSNELINRIHALPDSYRNEEILAPYHEMFADAFAVLYTGNPQSLKFALSNPEDQKGLSLSHDELEELNDRDYSYLRDPKKWNKSEAHSSLTPFLSYWWDKTSKESDFMANRRHILRRLYNIILEEVRIRIATPELYQLSPEQMNIRLIKRYSGLI